MRWYVRNEHGEVRGPMSQDDAEFERDRLDGAVMYNERIFEPRFVTTKEVDALLADLKTIGDVWNDRQEPGEEGGVAQRAINALILLSKQQKSRFIMSEEIAVLLVDLEGLKNESGWRRLGLHPAQANVVSGLLERAIEVLVSLSREKVVELEIEEGRYCNLKGEMPVGVRVVVRDYDIEGHDPDAFDKDESGRPYTESVFSGS